MKRPPPETRQRQPRKVDPGYLAFLRTQRCCVCLCEPPVEAAHIRMACPERGKRSTGMQEKPDDRWAAPLCARCHRTGPRSQHSMGERVYWKMVCVDPFAAAEQLYAQFDITRPQRKTITIKGRTYWRSAGELERERDRRASVRSVKARLPKRKLRSRNGIPRRPTQWPKRKFQK